MSLKLADLEDYEDFLRMTLSFYEESPFYPEVTYSRQAITRMFELALKDPRQCLVLFLLEGTKRVGMLVGIASTTPFSDDLVASELAWYIEPEYRGHRKAVELVEAYEEWAHRVGCSHVTMALLTTLTDASKFYERRGYKKTEISFIKSLNLIQKEIK